MTKINNNSSSFYILFFGLYMITLLFSGCDKFLEQKPDARLATASTLKDLQALLDYHGSYVNDPNVGEISSDDYYVTDEAWSGISSDYHRRVYIWEKDDLFAPGANNWYTFSTSIYGSNAVIEGLDKIARTSLNASEYDNIKGQALFFRGKNVLSAANIWCLAYDEVTASSDLGLPLRQNTDFNELSVRSSVQQTYDQVIADLKAAILLLPIKPISYMRASQPGAYAALARAYHSMRKYKEAGLYADSCLQLFDTLIDYNTLKDSKATYPFVELNEEVISVSGAAAEQMLSLSRAKTSPNVYESFSKHDLRKELFFTENTDGSHGFVGNYSGRAGLFTGLATDEMYLIRAECSVREGKVKAGMDDLNKLLLTRFESGTFKRYTTTDGAEALKLVLQERRKQLLFRGLRWMDIKRLNKEGANITLTRVVHGKTYTLPPNDLRWALPIPDDVIAMSGVKQNPR